jgi:hypothetical protein
MIQMNELTTSVCRNCRFYQPKGRQGGICQHFQVPVDGSWSSCQLSLPAFSPAWQSIQDLPVAEQLVNHPQPQVASQTAIPTADPTMV